MRVETILKSRILMLIVRDTLKWDDVALLHYGHEVRGMGGETRRFPQKYFSHLKLEVIIVEFIRGYLLPYFSKYLQY